MGLPTPGKLQPLEASSFWDLVHKQKDSGGLSNTPPSLPSIKTCTVRSTHLHFLIDHLIMFTLDLRKDMYLCRKKGFSLHCGMIAIDNQIKLSLSVSLLPSSLLLQCKVASYNRWSFTQVSFLYGGPLWWVGRGFQYGNVITCHWRSEHFNNCRMNRLLSPDKSRAHTTPSPLI